MEAASAIPRGSSAGAGLHCAAYASRARWRSDRIELISLWRRSLLVALGVNDLSLRNHGRNRVVFGHKFHALKPVARDSPCRVGPGNFTPSRSQIPDLI